MKGRAWITFFLSAAAFLVPGALIVGADLSPVAQPRGPTLIRFGDTVALDIVGTMDNGTTFLDNRSLKALVGGGDLVPGLDAGLVGLSKGSTFNVTVAPQDGYGLWTAKRTAQVQANESMNRTFSVTRIEFESQVGSAPYKGQRLATEPWSTTVIQTDPDVVLRYEPTLNATLHLYRYWASRVVAVSNATIRWENLLRPGDTISVPAGRGQRPTTFRVTTLVQGNFTLDSNPPLAGERLHFRGTVKSVKRGVLTRRSSGDAVSLSSQSCEQCHGGAGFVALQASAAATRDGDRADVNVTITDPWLHDLRAISLNLQAKNMSATGLRRATGSDVRPQASETLHESVPVPPGNATIHLVINATAHHHHLSGGKPDQLPYQLVINVTIGASAGSRPTTSAALARVRTWDAWGRITGFVALGVLAVPAVQGYRRHRGSRPLFRRPAWLTTHFVTSWLVVLFTLVHAELLMSATWRGQWSWGVVAGLVALILFGLMGLSGMVLAAWVPLRWPELRTWHYRMMLAAVALALWHTVAIGTTWASLTRSLLGR